MTQRAAMTQEIIIIGGGIIGCSIAYALTRAGLRATLLEQGTLAEGTTGNSFAWANASSKTTNAAYHRLNAAGVAGYQALIAEYGAEQIGIRQTGALQVVSRSDAAGFRAMQDDFAALTRFGYPCEWLDGAALQAETPALSLPADAEALLLPSDMVVDAPKAARTFAELARLAGANIRENCPAQALIADDDGAIQGVETSNGSIHAANVILAAGADTGSLLAQLTGFDGFSTRFPLRQVPGLLLTTPPIAPNPLTRVIYGSTTNELHMLPAPNGGIRIGSDDVDGIIWEDRSPSAMQRGGTALLKRAAQVIPDLPTRVRLEDCHLQIGVRPYPEDGLTIAGPLPGSDGLIIVATHSGITLAPAIAAHMVDLVKTGAAPGLTGYGLSRFPGF
ncbi:FAD-dependent oxidoreductase [Alisedimentitalea sp. MJ-SS2]|uniref:NAD(P)/FAD-dependent oxidoreductase n=1 Tax=Aliisedimentitalea sp. MJ-SS2 TaxID=3049795 RepID=UPI00290666CB|nr:FAD-dependent oxidoreductase [Alisedimentitalea sp. MJ-SS2]MDU8929861.1 FAD-dependent oxidoreductase [Alisedimentitalea sp. MJ-SS2]